MTPKSKEAIDLYLSEDPECKRNGSRSWQRVYGTQSLDVARKHWHRMVTKGDAQRYLYERNLEIEQARKTAITYDRISYMSDLLAALRVAMSLKQFYLDGEWREIPGTMQNISAALRIAKALYAEETGNTFPRALKDDHPRGLERPDEIVDVSAILAKFQDLDEEGVVERPPYPRRPYRPH